VRLLAAIFTAFVVALASTCCFAALAWGLTRLSGAPATPLACVVAAPATALGFGLVVGHLESLAGGLAATSIGGVLAAVAIAPIAWFHACLTRGETPEKLTYVAIGLTCGCCLGAFEAQIMDDVPPRTRSGLRAVTDGLLSLTLATALGVGLYYLAQIPADKPSGNVSTLFSGLLLLLGMAVFLFGGNADLNWKAAMKRMTLPAGYFLSFGAATTFVMDRHDALRAISDTLYVAIESSGFGLLAGNCVAVTVSIARRLVPFNKRGGAMMRLLAVLTTWVLLFAVAFRHLDATYRWWSVASAAVGALAGAATQMFLLRRGRPKPPSSEPA
jgi:hypothetical protein